MSHRNRIARVTLSDHPGAACRLVPLRRTICLVTLLANLAAVTRRLRLLLKFIGACEVAGAAGPILPGVLHTKEWLTPLAALGLAIIMTGAVVVIRPSPVWHRP